MRKLFLFLLTLLSLASPPTTAEVVKGRVIDTSTKETLEGVMVFAVERYGETLASASTMTDSLGCFRLHCGAFTTFEFTYLGYHKAQRTLACGSSTDEVSLGDILLKPAEVLLKSAQVKGQRRRFFMRGDTVVFNPAAFDVQDGDRLEKLLRQLPGVTIDRSGAITWNGKPVRLLVDGESLFDERYLTAQLPAIAVENIKAYNRRSERSHLAGRDDGEEHYVLDVKVKPGWLDSLQMNAELAARTPHQGMAMVDGMRLSKNTPVMFMVNLNNMGEFTRQGASTSWRKNGTEGDQEYGQLNLSHRWGEVTLASGAKRRNAVTVSIDGGRMVDHGRSWQTSSLFLPGEAPSHTLSRSTSRQRDLDLRLDGNAFLYGKKDLSFTSFFGASVTKTRRDSEDQSARLDRLPPMDNGSALDRVFCPSPADSALMASLVNRQRYATLGETTRSEAHYQAGVNKALTLMGRRASLGGQAEIRYDDERSDLYRLRDLRYGGSDSFQNEYAHSPSHHIMARGQANLMWWMTDRLSLYVVDDLKHDRSTRHREQYRLDKLVDYMDRNAARLGERPTDQDSLLLARDGRNSEWARTDQTHQNVNLTLRYQLGALDLRAGLGVSDRHERLQLHRGDLVTEPSRHVTPLSPAMMAMWRIGKGSGLDFHTRYTTDYAGLDKCTPYVDDTDPLNVYRGNAGLRASHTWSGGISYHTNLVKSQLALAGSLNARATLQPVGTFCLYDPQTGAYQTTPVNVRGGNSYQLSLQADKGFGAWQLSTRSGASWDRSYGNLTATAADAPIRLNRRDGVGLTQDVRLRMNKEAINLTLCGNLDYRHSGYSADRSHFDLFDYYYGVEGDWRLGKLTLAPSLRMYCRRGYQSAAMNEDRPLLSATVSYKVLGGRGDLHLKLADILNRDSQYRSEQTPTTHTESYTYEVHNYVMLTFNYRLEAKKKP